MCKQGYSLIECLECCLFNEKMYLEMRKLKGAGGKKWIHLKAAVCFDLMEVSTSSGTMIPIHVEKKDK